MVGWPEESSTLCFGSLIDVGKLWSIQMVSVYNAFGRNLSYIQYCKNGCISIISHFVGSAL